MAVRSSGRHTSAVLQDWKARFENAFDTEFREWADAVAAGAGPTGPSAWDGYAATVITDALVQALESGEIVRVDALKERPVLYGGASR